jgi:hypothetical protein
MYVRAEVVTVVINIYCAIFFDTFNYMQFCLAYLNSVLQIPCQILV